MLWGSDLGLASLTLHHPPDPSVLRRASPSLTPGYTLSHIRGYPPSGVLRGYRPNDDVLSRRVCSINTLSAASSFQLGIEAPSGYPLSGMGRGHWSENVISSAWTRPVEPEDFLGCQMAPGAEKLIAAPQVLILMGGWRGH
jgi:hypothetical protein